MRKSAFGTSDQVTRKPARLSLEISDLDSIAIIQSRKRRTTKAPIRLRGYAGWSASLLFAYGIKQVFSWRGSYVNRGSYVSRILVIRVMTLFSQRGVQDQDSLLVKRRNDNHSPGPVIRELIPSSHQRSELSNTILCIFSGWDQRIGEGIPIPDSLGEEATFINICIGNGSLKCHRVLISTAQSFGDKVNCWYPGFTFKTFI